MYYYDAGCIDFFDGLIPLQDFVDQMRNKGDFWRSRDIEKFKQWLKIILVEAFLKLNAWENHENITPWIYIGGIPNMDCQQTDLFVVWKQGHQGANGLTFIAFPFTLSGFSNEYGPKELNAINIKKALDLVSAIINEIS